MHEETVVGIIGGQGWMGRSLGLALLERGILTPEQLVISSRSGRGDAYRDWPGVRCAGENRELAELADVIVLSVRPQDLPSLAVDADDKLVISLLAMPGIRASPTISPSRLSCRSS